MAGKTFGCYETVRVLGRGATSVVYEARDPLSGNRVAIKAIAGNHADGNSEAKARFRAEAATCARLQHPHIVRLLESGSDGTYLVMELVDGDDLRRNLDAGERFSPAMALSITFDLLSALHHAHAHGVIHRDVKPANILIDKGRVRLTDFGIAQAHASCDRDGAPAAVAVGTLRYMSPEQAQGQRGDARSDLFSAGVVLYELLTGIRPFDGENPFAVIHRIVNVAPAPPSRLNARLPARLDGVLARALAKDPAQRFQSARAFTLALRAAGEPPA